MQRDTLYTFTNQDSGFSTSRCVADVGWGIDLKKTYLLYLS